MKVLVYNHKKGFVKYIPLAKPSFGYDFDINKKIMPPVLFQKLEIFMQKRDKRRKIDWNMPIGITAEGARRAGCEIIAMNRARYESLKDETT